MKKLIRFDWAMKKLLRDKANFSILEGFLSVLLKETIFIKQILDSESNKETENDRHNRVDVLVENGVGELIIIEVQNSKEYDYFHRMVYGTSKVISEHIKAGEPYASVKKVIAITIAYFDLGQGEDYVYHGTNLFRGIHKGDVLSLASKQQTLYGKQAIHEIFPEYWIIKADKFDGKISDKLDEWIYFLKNGEVLDEFTAQGLTEVKDRLDELKMTQEERVAYNAYLKRLHDIASEQYTKKIDMQDELKRVEVKAEKRRAIEIAKNAILKGLDNQLIVSITGLLASEIEALRKELRK